MPIASLLQRIVRLRMGLIENIANKINGLIRASRGKRSTIWTHYQSDAMILSNWLNLSPQDLAERQQHHERLNPEISQRIANWYLPPFKYAFFGGVMTILRLASHLKTAQGVKSRFIIVGDADPREISLRIGNAFPALKDSQVVRAPALENLEDIPFADYSFATFWTTAYYLQKVKNTGLKFYVVQDFEPLFYPAGSTYAQVEETYKFGFYGICNTETLRKKYLEYGSSGETLVPAVDRSIFYPDTGKQNRPVKKLFFYARPDTPRNMFELVAPALIQAKEALGDTLEIQCAGGDWDPAEFGLDGIVEVLGLLSYEQTGELYRDTDIGLAFMMTPHPSYLPFELMASGALVIANENKDNEWLLKNGKNCLTSRATVTCIAETIIHAVKNYDELLPLRGSALELIDVEHSSWSKSLEKIELFITGLG